MMSIDLHGQIESEATVNIELFLKECVLKKVKHAKVTHGNGEFILRGALVKQLNNQTYVHSYNFAPSYLGGTGTTIINFKYK